MGRDPLSWEGPRDSGKSRQKSLYCRTAIIASGRDPGVVIAGAGPLAGGLDPANCELLVPGPGFGPGFPRV